MPHQLTICCYFVLLSSSLRYLLLVIDCYSKFLWGKTFPQQSVEEVAKYLWDLFLSLKFPERWHADNGGPFIGEVIKVMYTWSKGKETHGLPLHPQSQGQIERANATVKRALHAHLAGSKVSTVTFKNPCLQVVVALTQPVCCCCHSGRIGSTGAVMCQLF